VPPGGVQAGQIISVAVSSPGATILSTDHHHIDGNGGSGGVVNAPEKDAENDCRAKKTDNNNPPPLLPVVMAAASAPDELYENNNNVEIAMAQPLAASVVVPTFFCCRLSWVTGVSEYSVVVSLYAVPKCGGYVT